jgi:hypothetical protein
LIPKNSNKLWLGAKRNVLFHTIKIKIVLKTGKIKTAPVLREYRSRKWNLRAD